MSQALSGVEIALWDIAGKLADKPAYELLGRHIEPDVFFEPVPGDEHGRKQRS